MKFSLGSQFSREFSFEESRITNNLADELNLFFEDRDYGKRVTKIYVSVICVSIDFEPFFPIRPLKIMRKEPAINYEFKLDFETFKSLDSIKRKSVLINSFFKETKLCLEEKSISNFNKDQFILDLKTYFIEKGFLK